MRYRPITHNLILASALVFASCSEDKKKDAPAPAQPSVEITAAQAQADGRQLVTYKSDLEKVTFECKIDQGNQVGQWTACPETGYQLSPEPGATILFSVRAKKDGQISTVATRLIMSTEPKQEEEPAVKLVAIINEKSDPSKVEQPDGSLRITFGLTSGSTEGVRYECKIGAEGQFNACSSPLVFTRLQNGQMPQYITVTPYDLNSNESGVEDTINFEVSQLPQRPAVTQMLLGSNYIFRVPEGMHVTEYSSSKTVNRAIDAFRIMTESDPYYIGNTQCAFDFGQVMVATGPDGQPIKYCNFTPNDDVFKFMTDARWARNHIAVHTNVATVAQNPTLDEHMMFNVFDSDPEFHRGKTRFWDLCGRDPLNVDLVPNITMGFDFWGDEIRTTVYTCLTQLATRAPGSIGGGAWYRVAGFFVTDRDANLYTGPVIDLYDPEVTYALPHLLEAIYVARADGPEAFDPGIFVRKAQNRMAPNIQSANYR